MSHSAVEVVKYQDGQPISRTIISRRKLDRRKTPPVTKEPVQELACVDCPSYNEGAGSKKCRRCNKYHIILPRDQSVKCHELPDFIMQSIPAEKKFKTLCQYLSKLDLLEATILMQTHLIAMTTTELQSFHNMSRGAIQRKKTLALKSLRKIIAEGM